MSYNELPYLENSVYQLSMYELPPSFGSVDTRLGMYFNKLLSGNLVIFSDSTCGFEMFIESSKWYAVREGIFASLKLNKEIIFRSTSDGWLEV